MTLGVIRICYFTECGMSHGDVPNQLFFFRALFLYVFFFGGVAISTVLHRHPGRFWPNCGHMAVRPKLKLCLTWTAAESDLFGYIRAY